MVGKSGLKINNYSVPVLGGTGNEGTLCGLVPRVGDLCRAQQAHTPPY